MSAQLQIRNASMEEILISGGDARSVIDQQTGLNSFGCSPLPRPDAHSYGSSTASSISNRAYKHLEDERRKLFSYKPGINIIDVQFEKMRHELLAQLRLEDCGAEIVFSPSGTDSTLQSLFLVKGIAGRKPLDCILLAADETGSGVPNALAGRHFSTITSKGLAVSKGDPIVGLAGGVTIFPVSIRTNGGVPKSSDAIDQEVYELVSRSVKAGNSVLLQAIDSSKLGARCPGHACLQLIKSRFGDAVQLVIDACQMRLSRSRLKWHIDEGHIVLISGSKFFTGPPFSGALLIPKSLNNMLSKIDVVPAGLFDYSCKSDWPLEWTSIRSQMPESENVGQYFRWAAALDEMKTYFSVPSKFRTAALKKFADMVCEQIGRRSPDIVLMPEQNWPADDLDDEEMSARTIFPILIRRGEHCLSFADSTAIYRDLNQNIASALPDNISSRERTVAAEICHLGQPVSINVGKQDTIGALRICASARTVSNIWSRQDDSQLINIERETYEIISILDKIELVSRYLPAIYEKAA